VPGGPAGSSEQYWLDTNGRRGYVYHLAVTADCRHQGIGKTLVANVEREMTHHSIWKAHAHVVTRNLRAQFFWKKSDGPSVTTSRSFRTCFSGLRVVSSNTGVGTETAKADSCAATNALWHQVWLCQCRL